MSGPRHIILAAGGTGGHVVPAHALGEALQLHGYDVSLITDSRGMAYPGLFETIPRHVIPAATVMMKKPGTWLSGFRTLLEGRSAAERLMEQYTPAVVVGFGGYPSLPAMWAAVRLKVPTIIHEQNAVLGRSNRWLASSVDVVATSFAITEKMPRHHKAEIHVTGNPVRANILALRDEPYPELDEDSIFRVLVLGGSQGATILSDVVPAALSILPTSLKRRLQVTQQCRAEDMDAVRAHYKNDNIAADLFTYIEDMASQLRFAHLVIARAGASTLAELTAVGRPAIFVPLPGAKDNHQAYNTREMVERGGARMIVQRNFTPAELAKQIQKMALTPYALGNAAALAKDCGRPNAVHDLVALVEGLVK